jgi:hypothetical protein
MAKVESKGIELRGKQLSVSRPQDEAKRRLYLLPPDRGFPIIELATTWNVSVDTLRKYCHRHDCLRYVEVNPGEWVQCVLHPETAAQSAQSARKGG